MKKNLLTVLACTLISVSISTLIAISKSTRYLEVSVGIQTDRPDLESKKPSHISNVFFSYAPRTTFLKDLFSKNGVDFHSAPPKKDEAFPRLDFKRNALSQIHSVKFSLPEHTENITSEALVSTLNDIVDDYNSNFLKNEINDRKKNAEIVIEINNDLKKMLEPQVGDFYLVQNKIDNIIFSVSENLDKNISHRSSQLKNGIDLILNHVKFAPNPVKKITLPSENQIISLSIFTSSGIAYIEKISNIISLLELNKEEDYVKKLSSTTAELRILLASFSRLLYYEIADKNLTIANAEAYSEVSNDFDISNFLPKFRSANSHKEMVIKNRDSHPLIYFIGLGILIGIGLSATIMLGKFILPLIIFGQPDESTPTTDRP